MISIIPHPKDACVTKQAAQPKAHAARGQKPICSFHHGRVIPYRNTASQQAIRTHARTRTQGLHSKQRARAPFCLLHSPPGQKQKRLTGGRRLTCRKVPEPTGLGWDLRRCGWLVCGLTVGVLFFMHGSIVLLSRARECVWTWHPSAGCPWLAWLWGLGIFLVGRGEEKGRMEVCNQG